MAKCLRTSSWRTPHIYERCGRLGVSVLSAPFLPLPHCVTGLPPLSLSPRGVPRCVRASHLSHLQPGYALPLSSLRRVAVVAPPRSASPLLHGHGIGLAVPQCVSNRLRDNGMFSYLTASPSAFIQVYSPSAQVIWAARVSAEGSRHTYVQRLQVGHPTYRAHSPHPGLGNGLTRRCSGLVGARKRAPPRS